MNKKATAHVVTGKWDHFKNDVPDADALMNPTKSLKDEETGVLNKILQASDQKEVIHKNLKENRPHYCKHHILQYKRFENRKFKIKTKTKCSFY